MISAPDGPQVLEAGTIGPNTPSTQEGPAQLPTVDGAGVLPGAKSDLACALEDDRVSSSLIGRAISLGFWPSELYVRGEDNARVQVFNEVAGVTITVTFRVLTPSGEIVPFQQTFVPASNRASSVLAFGLMEGWVLSADAIASAGAPIAGRTYVLLQLQRGLTGAAARVLTFAAGYVTAIDAIFWPGGVYLDSLEGAGAQISVQQANPVAGNDFTITVPAGVRWQLQSVFAQLATSAAVANRQPRLRIDDGVNFVYIAPAVINETASLNWVNSWAAGAGTIASIDPAAALTSLPNDLFLLAGWHLTSFTNNIQGADQWSQISIAVRSWLDT